MLLINNAAKIFIGEKTERLRHVKIFSFFYLHCFTKIMSF